MKLAGTFTSYPVFPSWVFEGKLELTDEIVTSVLQDVTTNLQSEQVHFGSLTRLNNKSTQSMIKITKLMGSLFVENVASHLRVKNEANKIESVDSQLLTIRPTRCVPASIQRNRWYQGAVFLQATPSSSHIYLDSLDTRLYATPVGVQEYTHLIAPLKYKVVFWPSHIPWGFTPNTARSDTIVYTTSYIIKR